jgi:hypothetical protein
LGEQIWQETGSVEVHTVTLEKELIENTRAQLPFLEDADKFIILDEA